MLGADTKLAPLKSAAAPVAAAMVVLEVDAMMLNVLAKNESFARTAGFD